MDSAERVKGMPLNPESYTKHPDMVELVQLIGINYNEVMAKKMPEFTAHMLVQEAINLLRKEYGGVSSEVAAKISAIAIEEGKDSKDVSHDYYTPEFAEKWTLSQPGLKILMDTMRSARIPAYMTSESYLKIHSDSHADDVNNPESDDDLTPSGVFTMKMIEMVEDLKKQGYTQEEVNMLLHRVEDLTSKG